MEIDLIEDRPTDSSLAGRDEASDVIPIPRFHDRIRFSENTTTGVRGQVWWLAERVYRADFCGVRGHVLQGVWREGTTVSVCITIRFVCRESLFSWGCYSP